ncbi:MAG: peptidoglycan DD-metalloendopeptidase family protein [Anaerolineaceae bacterium]|nr:peptidoglycan DD-metalloendopeptidase family protein [Anaerolineaceae bacterium]
MQNIQEKITLMMFYGLIIVMLLLSGCLQFSGNNIFEGQSLTQKQGIPTPKSFTDERIIEINETLQDAVQSREDVLAFLLYRVTIEQVEFSIDEDLALVWIAFVDPDNGQIIPGESGLAIAKLINKASNTDPEWEIVLQSDPQWKEELESVPEYLLDEELRANYLPDIQVIPHAHQTYSGYRLPWEPGKSRYLTGSIGHVYTYKTCPSTCLYAFDFSDGTMFPVLAAKSGIVKYAVWRHPNGNTKHANFIVLEDRSTNPTTYQVYLHLAQDSIPAELTIPGAEVVQGQQIGIADDTGASTGHHLHFQVHTNPTSYWGNSVDITFDDVNINGGRPRTCGEARYFPEFGSQCASGNSFVSGNNDYENPTGGISNPSDGEIIEGQYLIVDSWSQDDLGIALVQLIMTTDGEWKAVGPVQTQADFTTIIDLCASDIPDGYFFLALQIIDQAGKHAEGLPGLTKLEKRYLCPAPPPKCEIGEHEIALFSETDFQGTCEIFEVGHYGNSDLLSELFLEKPKSIQVSDDIYASVSEFINQTENQRVFLSSDSDIEDDLASFLQISSLDVEFRPPFPQPPLISIPGMMSLDEINLTWGDVEGVEEYGGELTGPNDLFLELDWTDETHWAIGELPPGDFECTIIARNVLGTSEASIKFTINMPDDPPVTQLDNLAAIQNNTAIHISWTLLKGENDIKSFRLQYRDNYGNWIDLDKNIPAQNRNKWFIGEPGHTYEFRISGSDHAGNLESFDESNLIKTTIAGDCLPDIYDLGIPDNSLSNATPLEYGETHIHNFCGSNDIDWITIQAAEGQTILIKALPEDNGVAVSALLFEIDGLPALEEQQPLLLDSTTEFNWTPPHDGIYYIRLRPIDPRVIGTDTKYSIRIDKLHQVYSPGLLISSLVLPILWAAYKFYHRLRNREN